MRTFEILPSLREKLEKLSRKNKSLYEQTHAKMDEIFQSQNIDHYKNLRHELKHDKRVHIGSFVLLFEYDPKKDKLTFNDFDHHDNIYKKR